MRKILFTFITTLSLAFLLTGCASDNVLTQQEIKLQSQADIAISEILFNQGLDTKASYKVQKDGHVDIEFIASVSMFDYTQVVEKIRTHKDVTSVTAVQAGNEVCPLK